MVRRKINKTKDKEKYNIFATLGFLFSLVGITSFGILSVLGLVFSIIGLVQIKKKNERGKVLAIIGIVLSILTIIVVLIIAFVLGWLVFLISTGGIVGSGNVSSQTYDFEEFRGVEVNGQGNIIVTQGEWSVVIEAEDNILEKIEVSVEDDLLIIDKKEVAFFRNTLPINIQIQMPEVESLDLNGFGSIKSEGVIMGEKLNVGLSGSGDIDLILDVVDLFLVVSGSGDVILRGKTTNQDLKIEGSGNINGADFMSKNAKIVIFGSGDVDVDAEDELEVQISGSGAVNYVGSPSLSQTIYGSGEIRKV